jgi:hypothetical protein
MVFDSLFSPELLGVICKDFDEVHDDELRVRRNDRELTYRSRTDMTMPVSAQLYFDTVNSARFVKFLTELTGIPGLITDALLKNGGLHESRDGGKFDTHLDFTKHPITELDNRLVLITYLNHDWREEYGGALELWSVEEDRCITKVIPEFGRSILFEQSSVSLHGHPGPIKTPDGRRRRSLATYYYSNGLDDSAADQRYTSHFRDEPRETALGRAVQAVKYVVPPIVVDAGRLIRGAVTRR